jgi:hypothetical protein
MTPPDRVPQTGTWVARLALFGVTVVIRPFSVAATASAVCWRRPDGVRPLSDPDFRGGFSADVSGSGWAVRRVCDNQQ